MLSRYAHLSPTHLYQAVEDLTRIGTITKTTVTTGVRKEGEAHKLLEDMVSRLGLEPRTLALKARKDQNINGLILRRFPRFFFANKGLR